MKRSPNVCGIPLWGMSVLSIALFGASVGPSSNAADQAPQQGEKLNVDNIKQKYWAKGSDAQMSVVQNRLYSKEHKIEFSLFGGSFSNDPFLSTKMFGTELGFHLSEYIGIHGYYWHLSSGKSSAASDFLKFAGFEANTNKPERVYGGEVTASLLYGKLSVLGEAIIYYDMHLSAGLGVMDTASGNYLSPVFGVGQQVYLNQWSAIRLAYRRSYHSESVKGLPNKRNVWTDTLQVGLSFFIL